MFSERTFGAQPGLSWDYWRVESSPIKAMSLKNFKYRTTIILSLLSILFLSIDSSLNVLYFICSRLLNLLKNKIVEIIIVEFYIGFMVSLFYVSRCLTPVACCFCMLTEGVCTFMFVSLLAAAVPV